MVVQKYVRTRLELDGGPAEPLLPASFPQIDVMEDVPLCVVVSPQWEGPCVALQVVGHFMKL